MKVFESATGIELYQILYIPITDPQFLQCLLLFGDNADVRHLAARCKHYKGSPTSNANMWKYLSLKMIWNEETLLPE